MFRPIFISLSPWRTVWRTYHSPEHTMCTRTVTSSTFIMYSKMNYKHTDNNTTDDGVVSVVEFAFWFRIFAICWFSPAYPTCCCL